MESYSNWLNFNGHDKPQNELPELKKKVQCNISALTCRRFRFLSKTDVRVLRSFVPLTTEELQNSITSQNRPSKRKSKPPGNLDKL